MCPVSDLTRLVVLALMLTSPPDAAPSPPSAEQPPAPKTGKKYALLVGVRQYDSKSLPSLPYAENDARDLAGELRKAGYSVVLLTTADRDNPPTLGNVERQLDALLARATKDDLLLIGLAGHG